MPVYQSDDQWRTALIMNLIRLRQALYELGVAAGCIALGFAFNAFWEWAFVVGAGMALLVSASAVTTVRKQFDALDRVYTKSLGDDIDQNIAGRAFMAERMAERSRDGD